VPDEIAPTCADAGRATAANNNKLKSETAKRAIGRVPAPFSDISSIS
jgi:hypothetical protein